MSKLFIFSDSHGFFKETINALEEAGYDENNQEHKLICLGDFTDRGSESLQMYEFLYRLTKENKAIVLQGNHTKFLIDFLEGSYSPFNYLYNGLRETIADFWHRTAPFESWCMLEGNCEMTNGNYAKWVDICRKDILEEYPELLPWLKSLPRYAESKNYIMVHAAIDTKVEDWHYPHCELYGLLDWDALDFDDGSFFKEKNATSKKIIAGHFGTGELRQMYNIGSINDNSILETEDGKIFLDGCTVLSKKVNVLVIDDELLE